MTKWISNPGVRLMIERIKVEKKDINRVFLITLSGSILAAFIPFLYGKIVRMAGNDITPPIYLLLAGVMWLMIDQQHNWTTRYSDKHGTYKAWDIGCELFTGCFAHLIRLPMSFLSEQMLGKVVQRYERGSDVIERMIRDVLFSLVPSFLSLLFAFGFMFWIQWQLAGLVAITVALYTLAIISKNKQIILIDRETRKMWEEAWGHKWDVVNNIKAVKANTNEEFEIKRSNANFERCYAREKDAEELRQKIKTYEHLIFGTGAVVTMFLGFWMLRWKMIDAGGLFSFLGYIQLAYTPFSQLAHNWRFVLQGVVVEERVARFLEEKEEDYESGEEIKIAGDIEFRNVAFGYKEGGDLILVDINLVIKEGETVAIVGESGVGKTTLVELLSRYYEHSSGEIIIGGRNIKDWRLGSLRAQIAVVPQNVALFNDTIKLNIAYGDIEKLSDDAMIEDAARASYAHNFITGKRFTAGYNQVVGERGIKLSAGQMQRVAIARALLRDPKILILDEATSALDSESEMYVQQALEVLIKSRTTLIIAHRLSTVKKADKIVVLHDGGVAEIGRHEDLIARDGIYKKLVDLQSFQE